MALPTDPYFQYQWYVYNTGQGDRTPGIDLNLVDSDPNNFDVWDEYTGQGITVSVVDDGIPLDHPDLSSNYSSVVPLFPDYNYARLGSPLTRDDAHGTSVAGIIAAARNGIGTVGVAYNAKITSYNSISSSFRAIGVVAALARQKAFDVSNNSWAYDNPFSDNPRYFPLGRQTIATLRDATTTGRNGLGTVLIFAAGNEFKRGFDVDSYTTNSSRFGIAVSAINGRGRAADYSSAGSSLLISAFAEGDEPTRGQDGFNIVTTDRPGNQGYNPGNPRSPILGVERSSFAGTDPNYTGEFSGTSAAAPQISGVVALMLQANPNLGYRDVQEILAYSARQNFPEQVRWQFNGAKNWNGGGLHVNDNYGFGFVDAHAAVRLAETWQLRSTAANETFLTSVRRFRRRGKDIPDSRRQFLEATLPVAEGLLINHAELDIQVNHSAIEDLLIELVSPAGTRSLVFDGSQLSKRRATLTVGGESVPFSRLRRNPELALELGDRASFRLGKFYQKGLNYVFTSTFHWGETSGGTWRVRVFDSGRLGKGNLVSARVNLYGDAITASDTYVYTEEFARFTDAATANRRVLTDTNGGVDTINAAALRSDLTLNLESGQSSTLAGNTLQITAGTVIENAIAGDGRDIVTGNAVDNQLQGGRNDDTLIGGGGNDVLLGGNQADTLIGCGAERGIATIDRLTGGSGADLFVLGDGIAVFYGDAVGAGAGLADYAVITDFAADADRIQLYGNASLYSLGASPIATETGTAIYLNRVTSPDLVAVIRGVNPTDLNLAASYFSYV
ncbi:S8 family serine peptidase [Oscillatoria sp. FACHB-1407]|uniref:S8 family serine peptidase n=1 Tax=Oscillatoria sp. FACHB-1407 TaxID=2692847 RepID=UPI001688028C|nr:S8 family serine peptidase [Oscillatoria sp. FACHB-1407]MBD2459867.1 S8 family serine peptidase [Oscillatoria sp. FACHB-1407]